MQKGDTWDVYGVGIMEGIISFDVTGIPDKTKLEWARLITRSKESNLLVDQEDVMLITYPDGRREVKFKEENT